MTFGTMLRASCEKFSTDQHPETVYQIGIQRGYSRASGRHHVNPTGVRISSRSCITLVPLSTLAIAKDLEVAVAIVSESGRDVEKVPSMLLLAH